MGATGFRLRSGGAAAAFLLALGAGAIVAGTAGTAGCAAGSGSGAGAGGGAAARGGGGAAMVRVFSVERDGYVTVPKVVRTEAEWRRILTAEQYRVTRTKGTERACSGALWNHHGKGVYRCVGCATDLFRSGTKFESGTGWPSFFAPVAPENVRFEGDDAFGMVRTEVLCAVCDAHLGHVFDDGPPPSGQRYCINSAALVFVPDR